MPDGYVDIFANSQAGAAITGSPNRLTEASFFQTDDGIIHLILRNETVPYLEVSESGDEGETWSRPRLTDFTDAIGRAHFGRLPDGRFFAMSCPAPALGVENGARTPAVLATSHDGVVFDRHYLLGDEPQVAPRMAGHAKHDQYGYPYLHVMGERAFMIYSRNKEGIFVGRFPLAAVD